MKPQEIELWAREIVHNVLNGQPVEDSRVELKALWLDAEKAAPRLAGHANASRGENILWLIGADERNRSLADVDATEKGNWFNAIEKYFDGFAPRLLVDVNFKVNGRTVVALYFDTATEAPYIVKNSKGSYPEYTVPWRVGTNLRAASRANLLTLLVPIRRLSTLSSEIRFNSAVARGNFGSLFRNQEFFKALESGLLDTLPMELKVNITNTYVNIENSNQRILGFHQFSGNWAARGQLGEEAKRVFDETGKEIVELNKLLERQNSVQI